MIFFPESETKYHFRWTAFPSFFMFCKTACSLLLQMSFNFQQIWCILYSCDFKQFKNKSAFVQFCSIHPWTKPKYQPISMVHHRHVYSSERLGHRWTLKFPNILLFIWIFRWTRCSGVKSVSNQIESSFPTAGSTILTQAPLFLHDTQSDFFSPAWHLNTAPLRNQPAF